MVPLPLAAGPSTAIRRGRPEERLSTVLRTFSLALDVGTPNPAAAEMLRRSGRAEAVIRLSPAPEPGSVLGDEERLPFSGERFDLAVSLLALHFTGEHRWQLQVCDLVQAHFDAGLFAKLFQLVLQFVIRRRHEMCKGQQLQLPLLGYSGRRFGEENTRQAS